MSILDTAMARVDRMHEDIRLEHRGTLADLAAAEAQNAELRKRIRLARKLLRQNWGQDTIRLALDLRRPLPKKKR